MDSSVFLHTLRYSAPKYQRLIAANPNLVSFFGSSSFSFATKESRVFSASGPRKMKREESFLCIANQESSSFSTVCTWPSSIWSCRPTSKWRFKDRSALLASS
eukprot:scaffold6361_cov124-Cylindrotheca_fusiformis.AAC.4